MNYINYVLSSYQTIQYPSIINHYIFVDPVYGTNINYPQSADGRLFTTTSYPSTANGGLLFPWGYPVQNTILSADLGLFKGITTLTIVPSALDETYYAIMKILYDFEGNDNVRNIEKGIVQNVLSNNTAVLDAGSPKDTNIDYTFTPMSLLSTTYYPTITVVNGDLSLNIFNLKITLIPDTIFKFDDFHLINTAQLTRGADSSLKSVEVFEIDTDGTNYVSNFLLLSSTNSATVSSNGMKYTPTPTPTVTPTPTITPTVTPTVTPTPSVTPTTSSLEQLAVEYVTYN